ncbi:hypothetical protein [Micromonospora sp. WMMD710]|uniref:hypothetical protein n=1 Tax=Micromonospora sp. WMMD710 TaxID=3016085 RepID=UPI002416C582|nr:hypothetical protein [Micromonospora sp. WMMD710]MDG4757390.1 hypothetical protein [Micromonospora sp. WMMD710]
MFQEPDRSQMTGGSSINGVRGGGSAADPPEAWDGELARAVRRVAVVRTGFYVVVLLIALGGQVSGAMERLDMPWYVALPAVGALELGGVVVLANADLRRRLGEQAILSRVLSAGIAVAAVAFNWLAHSNHLEGGFYAGMSLLGYLVWLMNTENQRRDRLRARRQLPPTTPAYEPVGHWLRHPWLTRRARSLAKADYGLGLYGSLDAARAQIRAERRQAALSKVLHRKITRALDATTADIAVAVYDLDEIARRLAEHADYDGLTALIAADLAPARVLAGNLPEHGRRRRWRRSRQPDPVALASAARLLADAPERLLPRAPEPPTATTLEPGTPSAPVVRPATPPAVASAAAVPPADTVEPLKPTEPTADGVERPPARRSRSTSDRGAQQTTRADTTERTASAADQADPPRASDWAALHAELAPLLPAAAPRRATRTTADRPDATRAETPSATDAPVALVDPSATVRPATRGAAAPRTATGRARVARVADPAGEAGPLAAHTRELPLVVGRDLPDLVDAAASRVTPPGAAIDAGEGATEQRPVSRPRQRRRDDAEPRAGAETVRRRSNSNTESAEVGRP